MTGIEFFILANPVLTYAIIFVGMFFEGEGIILLASFFAWNGKLGWLTLIFVVLLGTMAGDLLWYAGGRFLRNTRLGNWLDKKYESHTSSLDTNIREHYGRLAILSKFMYFTTHPTVFLVGWNKFPFRRFVWITFYATTVWALTVLAVGYFFGYAISLLGYKRIMHRVEIFAILLFGAVFIFGRIIKKFLSKRAIS
jgi:membrane protein DedA with SNARE-associated domain